MIQTIFNNIKSYSDLKITLESFTIQAPSKKKIKDSVPFMNGSYDFSTVATGGEQVFDERKIKCRYNLECKDRGRLWNKYSDVLSWLMEVGQSQLIFTDMPDCYYLAEVEEAPDFELIVKRAGIMTVEFIAYPFKFGVDYEGEKLWDSFNFETDYLQTNKFTINGSGTIQIYNPGRSVSPKVNCSSSMTVSNNGYTANFVSGDNYNWNFKLKKGLNNIVVSGTGTIKIIFRKEML